MKKIPYKFYKENLKSFHGLFYIVLMIGGTIGYFIQSHYNFPFLTSIEVTFLSSVAIYFASVPLVFRKKLREFKAVEQAKKQAEHLPL